MPREIYRESSKKLENWELREDTETEPRTGFCFHLSKRKKEFWEFNADIAAKIHALNTLIP
jgi:hypothetical protein